jgi:hypothetical protein
MQRFPKKKILPPKESVEGVALARWFRVTYPELDRLFWHTPNGGARDPRQAAQLKREGTKPGVPDYFLAFPQSHYHGLFLELKREKGGSLSKDQKIVIAILREQGFFVEVGLGWMEASFIIEGYLREYRRGSYQPLALLGDGLTEKQPLGIIGG